MRDWGWGEGLVNNPNFLVPPTYDNEKCILGICALTSLLGTH